MDVDIGMKVRDWEDGKVYICYALSLIHIYVNHIVHNTYQIDSIQLPNVSDVQSFINEFKNLPNLAQQYTLRR